MKIRREPIERSTRRRKSIDSMQWCILQERLEGIILNVNYAWGESIQFQGNKFSLGHGRFINQAVSLLFTIVADAVCFVFPGHSFGFLINNAAWKKMRFKKCYVWWWYFKRMNEMCFEFPFNLIRPCNVVWPSKSGLMALRCPFFL